MNLLLKYSIILGTLYLNIPLMGSMKYISASSSSFTEKIYNKVVVFYKTDINEIHLSKILKLYSGMDTNSKSDKVSFILEIPSNLKTDSLLNKIKRNTCNNFVLKSPTDSLTQYIEPLDIILWVDESTLPTSSFFLENILKLFNTYFLSGPGAIGIKTHHSNVPTCFACNYEYFQKLNDHEEISKFDIQQLILLASQLGYYRQLPCKGFRSRNIGKSYKSELSQETLNSLKGIEALNEKDSSPFILSILIPTLVERSEVREPLLKELNYQISALGLEDSIEILLLEDNREWTTGYKRTVLLNEAQGKYVCFIDDDDIISKDYIALIYERLLLNPDCLNLIGHYFIDDKFIKPFIHSIKYDSFSEDRHAYYRPPNHLNVIKRRIAQQFAFPNLSYAEDSDWALQINDAKVLKKEEFIDEPLYFYYYKHKE